MHLTCNKQLQESARVTKIEVQYGRRRILQDGFDAPKKQVRRRVNAILQGELIRIPNSQGDSETAVRQIMNERTSANEPGISFDTSFRNMFRFGTSQCAVFISLVYSA